MLALDAMPTVSKEVKTSRKHRSWWKKRVAVSRSEAASQPYEILYSHPDCLRTDSFRAVGRKARAQVGWHVLKLIVVTCDPSYELIIIDQKTDAAKAELHNWPVRYA